MSDELLPEGVSPSTQERIKELGAKVYAKPVDQLSKEELRNVIQMDMATFPTKMTVSAAATRPTEVKFATNNYHTSIEVDLSGVNDVIKSNLQDVEDKAKVIESYLSMKSALLNLIRIKHEGTENYIRDLLDRAITKDGCPKVGRNSS